MRKSKKRRLEKLIGWGEISIRQEDVSSLKEDLSICQEDLSIHQEDLSTLQDDFQLQSAELKTQENINVKVSVNKSKQTSMRVWTLTPEPLEVVLKGRSWFTRLLGFKKLRKY